MVPHRVVPVSFFCLLLIIPVGISGPAFCAQGGESSRFLQDAPSQWEEYARRTKDLQGRFDEQSSFKNVKLDVKFEAFVEVKWNERCKLLSMLSARTVRGEQVVGSKLDYWTPEVFGMNANYSFTLRRKTPSSPWVLTELNDKTNKHIPSQYKRTFAGFEFQTNVLVTLNDKYLRTLVQDPAFRVIGARRIQHDGEELVEVDFDYSREVENKDDPNMKGTMLLDPQRFWCVRSYRIEVSQRTITFQFLELGKTETSLPVPKRAIRETVWTYLDGTDPVRNEAVSRFEYNFSEPRRLPGDDEFTLSAFGLPDPVGFETKKPTPWYLWLGAAAIVCLVLGVTVRSLRRRATANT